MWKRVLETTKKAATSAAAAAAAAPQLATRKSPASSRLKAVTPATPVSPAVLLRLKQATSSKRANLPNNLPDAQDVAAAEADNPSGGFTQEILSILNGPDDAEELRAMEAALGDSEDAEEAVVNKILDTEWFAAPPPSNPLATWRKEVAREKKKRYIFKNTESHRFTRLMQKCADKLGAESALEFFGKLGRDTGAKEFNALIKICLTKAKACRDIDSAVEHIFRSFRLYEMMRDRGFEIVENSYRPFLLYLVDVGMSEEFEMFSAFFKDANPKSSSRIAYYEMLLWIRAQDEKRIQELRHSVEDNDEGGYEMAESYMLAFAESDRKLDFICLLESLDPTKILLSKYLSSIFQSLARLELKDHAEKLLQQMRLKESNAGKLSSIIFEYASNIPNIAVEDVIVSFNRWHEQFEVAPSISASAKIISACCKSSKINLALDVAECLCKSNPNAAVELFHPIIHACDQGSEFHMFEGAYRILTDAEESGDLSTVSLYNAIMLGYFREKNHNGAQMVMAQMQIAGVKPDSETFSYLIFNCESEEKISEYHNQLRQDGIHMSKHIYMSVVGAYARLGNFDMAKQVLQNKEIPPKYLNEIKSALVGALASNGKVLDGLIMYDEIKQSGCHLEPKAAVALIENTQTKGELDRLYQLLEELSDSSIWFDGCSRVLMYCVQHNHPNAAINLLKQLKEKDEMSTYMVIDQVFSQIWDMDPVNLDIGMEILQAVKELGFNVSRTSLDFLLSACVKAKDSNRAQLIWSEYESAGLPHNVLTSLRMYQALLLSQKKKAAKKLLRKMPKEDVHPESYTAFCQKVQFKKKSCFEGRRTRGVSK
uniref:Pentacotripeptide-repeat region of PRORP domain-containing protein n=1 Tax=Leersia perrieri TaxID=77586 RepID=A0A0D9VBU8_9ORYZ